MEYYNLLWAKKSDNKHYPLICHLLDTAAVVQKIWEKTLSESFKNKISITLNMDKYRAKDFFSFLAGLHDIGKATPDFQKKSKEKKEELKKYNFCFKNCSDYHHSLYSNVIIEKLLKCKIASPKCAENIAAALAGHHGKFPTSNDIHYVEINYRRLEQEWKDVFNDILGILLSLFNICDDNYSTKICIEKNHSFFIILAGLVSVADWIASAEEFFPYKGYSEDPKIHFQNSLKKTERAIEQIKWEIWKAEKDEYNFSDLFSKYKPNPLQQNVINISKNLKNASLVIIEAPMGDGKTEAAFYLLNHFNKTLEQNGAYFALPTQATANAMYNRLKIFFGNIYPDDYKCLKLIHGNAVLAQYDDEVNSIDSINTYNDDDSVESNKASNQNVDWFSFRKRGLLAPYGAGTIDQTLLSVLQTKHFFVRLFGLSHKTIIFDEVHAYDTYMSTLLERLLEWLAAIDANVILLSATLPSEKRKNMIEAWQKGGGVKKAEIKSEEKCPEMELKANYPRITYISKDKKINSTSFETQRKITIKLNTNVPNNINELAKYIINSVSKGGCAVCICNTVSKAQDVYSEIEKIIDENTNEQDGKINLMLFHARFPFEDRDRIEKEVINLFGKKGFEEGGRPKKAILVATQVVEQSLDIDFDIMFTELAPIDLILQRSGRLQRHNIIQTPNHLRGNPVLYLIPPKINKDNYPDFENNKYVYSEYILYRTWLVIKELKQIKIPEDVEGFIERVYNKNFLLTDDKNVNEFIEKLFIEDYQNEEDLKNKASNKYIKGPFIQRPLYVIAEEALDEDNPEIHKDLQALTRYSKVPTIKLICLNEGFDLKKDLNKDDILNLSKKIMQINSYTLFNYFINNVEIPHQWKKHSILKYLYPAIFNENGFLINDKNIQFKLDDKLGGLFLRKEELEI